MRAFEADGVPHRTRDLNAYDQFHLLREVGPVIPVALALDIGTAALDAEALTAALAGIAPTDITRAFAAAAGAAERDDGQGFGPASKAVPLPDMLAIVLAVIDANFADYLGRNRPDFRHAHGRRQEFEPATMPDGEGWLFRPCQSDPPLIPDALALFDGRLTIYHVAKFNDVLDVQAENDFRAMKAAEGKR